MQDVLFYLALLTLVSSALIWGQMFWGVTRVKRLEAYDPAEGQAFPKVSIIVPARNEARDIEQALQSLLALDYPDYEVLVVNDRSTDATGEILARMQTKYPQLAVATVTDLPRGWLGKNHALDYGAKQARGELLLFTDADIVMQPDTLRRAVTFLNHQKIDFLAMNPGIVMPSVLLEAFVTVFAMLFTIFTKPWRVCDPKSPAHCGIGAFNLIRAEVYRAVGTHQAIAMRPDDDLKLGKLVKKNGYACDVINGTKFISVRWYASLNELIHGLEKNAFSGLDYRIWLTVFSSTSLVIVHVWPFIAVWVTGDPTRWLNLAIIALHFTAYSATAWEMKVRWYSVFLYPIVFLLFVYILWRTMVLNLWIGGIRWRDTLYPLDELRANKV